MWVLDEKCPRNNEKRETQWEELGIDVERTKAALALFVLGKSDRAAIEWDIVPDRQRSGVDKRCPELFEPCDRLFVPNWPSLYH